MQTLHRELSRALIALAYFTRVPIPGWVGWSESELGRAARYFPVIGIFVGVIAALVLWFASRLWPLDVAVVLSMIVTVLLTGAFHEDGLADSADGFGGGYTRERVLEIMCDSRIGSFGGLALALALLAKFALLCALAESSLPFALAALVLAHALSRAAALPLMILLPYARLDAAAKAKPVAEGIRAVDAWLGVAIALATLPVLLAFGFCTPLQALLVVVSVIAVVLSARRYFHRRIQGYTGDALGATQQVAELAVYLALCARLA